MKDISLSKLNITIVGLGLIGGTFARSIKENIDVSKVTKSLFDIDYADFFNIEKNFEFSYK